MYSFPLFWTGLVVFSILLIIFIRLKTIKIPYHTFTQNEGPMVIAHRGGRGLWPENTLMAFHNAVKLGVDALELDIQRTKDGVFVVIHDHTLDRTTNGSGRVDSYTLAEIQQFDAGYRWTNDGGKTFPFRGQGVIIPTMEDVFKQFPDMRLNIEVKERTPESANALCNLVEKYRAANRVMIGSFYTRVVVRSRTVCPSIATSAGRAEVKKFFVLQLLGLSRFYSLPVHALEVPEFSGEMRVVSKRFIKAAVKRQRLPVYVWTVNEVDKMKELLDLGVKGIISDFPDRAMEVVKNFKNEVPAHG